MNNAVLMSDLKVRPPKEKSEEPRWRRNPEKCLLQGLKPIFCLRLRGDWSPHLLTNSRAESRPGLKPLFRSSLFPGPFGAQGELEFRGFHLFCPRRSAAATCAGER